MIIDCLADLHGEYPKLEGGDLLIVAGDLTATDDPWQYIDFVFWMSRQDYKKKIIIAGNHDNIAQNFQPFDIKGRAEWDYLCDSGTEFEGLKIWGSPWTRWFDGINPHCTAFTLKTEEELAQKWALIPEDIDILVTHSPPSDILDENRKGESCGSSSLLIRALEIKPNLHVFGHIHEGYGKVVYKSAGFGTENNTTFVNASIMNEVYDPVNQPIRIIL